MAEFDYWQRWALDLDDTALANAWAALGIAAAAGRKREGPSATLARVLEAANQAAGCVDWRFPDRGKGAKSARSAPALIRDAAPEDWARAWAEAVSPDPRDPAAPSPPPRLRIVDAPVAEPAFPWLRLLGETRPASAAVSFAIDAPRAELRIGWPLRFGFLGGDAAEEAVARAQGSWPANALSRSTVLGREQANCDVLVHRGTARTLLRELLDQRTKVKANAVLLLGAVNDDWGDVSARLASILTEVRGSGYVLLPPSIEDDDLGSILNLLVQEISHASTFDVAVAACLSKAQELMGRSFATATGCTDELLRFRLSDVAATYNRRLEAMPPGATLDRSPPGTPTAWRTRGMRGSAPQAVEAEADGGGAAPDAMEIDPEQLDFEHESDGGSDLAEVGRALEEAAIPPEARRLRATRFLQQQAYVRRNRKFEEATRGFLAGMPALVRVRIGPQEGKWNSLAAEFPVESLPRELEQWALTVWLSEPNHLPSPLRARIKLPHDGASTECEFRFKPAAFPEFEGRLTVLHRGRVIQTAVLRASVREPDAAAAEGKAPVLEEIIPVRHALGDLGERRQYDLAFVLNHTAANRPLAAGLSDDHAWITDLSPCLPIAQAINARLSPVAKSVDDYRDGLDGEKGRDLLVQLAHNGSWLHIHLVEEQLAAAGNRVDIAEKEYIQIVSTRSDAVIPFEFIYDYAAPDDKAKLCQHWREALKTGACLAHCDTESGKAFCPMGFWGVRKVIERHALTPELAKEGFQLYLQSEATPSSGTLQLGGVGVLGASQRVTPESLAGITTALNRSTGKAPSQASDWDAWITAVHDHRPKLLLVLAHTDGAGANVSLELGGKTIKSIQIKKQHLRSKEDDPPPLVALLGCDTAGTADDYGHHVAVFRARGAAVVIGTIATVFGDHAAQVACRLVEGLLPSGAAAPERLGETLRALKRQALLDNLLMPLCLVAYGDADWKLARE